MATLMAVSNSDQADFSDVRSQAAAKRLSKWPRQGVTTSC